MQKHQVRTEGDALAYMLECSLATVDSMAMKKSRPKGEYARQISIAQINYDWCVSFKVECDSSRVDEVKRLGGSVQEYAKRLEP